MVDAKARNEPFLKGGFCNGVDKLSLRNLEEFEEVPAWDGEVHGVGSEAANWRGRGFGRAAKVWSADGWVRGNQIGLLKVKVILGS